MSASIRVLVVEDESEMAALVARRMEAAGYDCAVAGDGNEAFELASREAWDLVVLDLGLPGKDGTLVCSELRAVGCQVPVLMMTARSDTADRVAGLELGADDYLPKPFEMAELMARAAALLRRSRRQDKPTARAVAFGDCSLDPSRRVLSTPAASFPLHEAEYRLLLLLASEPGRVWSRDDLLDRAWGRDVYVGPRTVDVHVAALRKKLAGSRTVTIETLRRSGYVLKVA